MRAPKFILILLCISAIGLIQPLPKIAHANQTGFTRNMCLARKGVTLVTSPGDQGVFYQAQKADFISCEGDDKSGVTALNGTGKVQPQLFVRDLKNDPVDDGDRNAFIVIKKGATPERAWFYADESKELKIMTEPDGVGADNAVRFHPRPQVASVTRKDDNSKAIFIVGSQVISDFADPYEQTNGPDSPLFDRRPELMYQVDVVDIELDKNGRPVDLNKNGIADTIEKYEQRKFTPEEYKARVKRGWTRSDFLRFKKPAPIKERVEITRRKPEARPAPVKPAPKSPTECQTCEPKNPVKDIVDVQRELRKTVLTTSDEIDIINDLDKMRHLTCKSTLGGFSNYVKVWTAKHAKEKSKFKSKLTRSELFAIDALARSMYGELLKPKYCDERHYVLWARIAYNRAQSEKNGLGERWSYKDLSNHSHADIYPELMRTYNSRLKNWQYDAWDPKDVNQKKMGCVNDTAEWDKMVVVAARTVMGNGTGILAMTKDKDMDKAKCYYSGRIGSLNPCKGRDLSALAVNGVKLIDDPSEFQCMVPQTTRFEASNKR